MAVSSTGTDIPKVLILGHSFVRRLRSDLHARFDERAAKNFDLQGTAEIIMHGVSKLRKMDMGVITRISPDIVILDIGTNDRGVHLRCAKMLWLNFCPHLTGQNNVDTYVKVRVKYFC
jgi:hypothetical protein